MDDFYTRLYANADTLFTTLAPIAFVLIVFSLWSNISGNRSGAMYMRALAHAIVVVAVLSQFPEWLKLGERVVDSLVNDTLQANPAEVFEKYKAMTATASDDAEGGGFWHTIFSEGQIFRAVIAAMLWLVQFFAKAVVFIAYIIYKVVLAFAIAGSPMFIGFLCVRSLSGIGMKFLLVTVGILLWPLGWGFSSLVTDALLGIMADEGFASSTGLEAFKNFVAVAFAGLWIIFTTIAAPLVIQKMISEGTNAGAAFLSGGWRAARAGVQSAATTGASMAATGVGAPLALAGAAGAGALASGSSALTGSNYSSIGEVAGNAARWKKSNSSYDSSDPANDKKAASLVGRSRKSKS
ncbi:MAG: hypothetical protein AB7Q64_23450 [Verrucomicrobiales bacterium]